LSVVDVRAAIRRGRLPLVASLVFAALLGAPSATEPAPPTTTVVAQSTASTPADATAVAEPVVAVEAPAPIIAAAPAAGADSPVLRDQAVRAALAPRAPPRA